jgi:hypothetical protein
MRAYEREGQLRLYDRDTIVLWVLEHVGDLLVVRR